MNSKLAIQHVNVFVGPRAQGNPAGVVRLRKGSFAYEAQMSQTARQLGYPETAFLHAPEGFSNIRRIRYYSQSGQCVPFCGHATLAAASVLHRAGQGSSFIFETDTGLQVTVTESDGWFELSRPIGPANDNPFQYRGALHHLGLCGKPNALSPTDDLPGTDFLKCRLLDKDLLVLLPAADMIDGWTTPSFPSPIINLVLLAHHCGGILLRYFAPGYGIPEDPATGSIALAVAEWLLPEGGEMNIYQASARGGHLRIRRQGGRVYVRGQCTFSNGRIPYP